MGDVEVCWVLGVAWPGGIKISAVSYVGAATAKKGLTDLAHGLLVLGSGVTQVVASLGATFTSIVTSDLVRDVGPGVELGGEGLEGGGR